MAQRLQSFWGPLLTPGLNYTATKFGKIKHEEKRRVYVGQISPILRERGAQCPQHFSVPLLTLAQFDLLRPHLAT